jgi:hypothetical protein
MNEGTKSVADILQHLSYIHFYRQNLIIPFSVSLSLSAIWRLFVIVNYFVIPKSEAADVFPNPQIVFKMYDPDDIIQIQETVKLLEHLNRAYSVLTFV